MLKKILLFIFIYLIAVYAYPQPTKVNDYTLSLRGELKDVKKFNSEQIRIQITTSALENGKFGITFKINKPGDFKLYLFDEAILKNQSFNVNDLMELYTSARNIIKDLTVGTGRYKLKFDGIFIDYDSKLITRTPWQKGSYVFAINTDKDIDSYTINNQSLNENLKLTISYSFLVVNDKRLVGVTNPVNHSIHIDIIRGLLPKKEEVAPAPPVIDPVISKWDKEVKSILVTFEGSNSYNDIQSNANLRRVYETGNFGDKINNAINDISRELSNEKFKSDRERFIAQLTPFKKVEVVAALTEEPTPEPAAQPVVTQQPQAAAEQPKPAAQTRRETTDKCTALRNQMNGVNEATTRLSREIGSFETKVTEGIQTLRVQLGRCIDNDCFSSVKRSFDNKGWEKELSGFEDRLNQQALNLRKVEQDPAFAECNLNTDEAVNRIELIRTERQQTAQLLSQFRIELEGFLINRDAFMQTVTAFLPEARLITRRFKEAGEMLTNLDNRLFDTGALDKNSIRELKSTQRQVDSTMINIELLIQRAEEKYRELTNNVGYFPEATFKNDTELQISENDIKYLQANLANLMARAERSKKSGYGTYIILGIIILLLLIGGYSYFMGVVKRKISKKQITPAAASGNFNPDNIVTREVSAGGIEIIDDSSEINKGKGLDMVRKLSGIKYYETDVQSFISDTAVRKVYFSKDFIIKAYRYFEDKMLQVGNGHIEELYEYGGFIVGNWDYSLYDSGQYDVSFEHFIEPGEDAKFSKFNIDFGYDISFRMEEMLIDFSHHGNEQVFAGWLHSHPGHNIFLSNYDIEVQETFRNQYHPNKHIALVLEPTTPKWDMGLFTFKKNGEMNNKEDVRSHLSFHELYSWAIGEKPKQDVGTHLQYKIEGESIFDTKTLSFDRSALLSIKIYIERELSANTGEQKFFYFKGIRSNNGKLGQDLHVVSMDDSDQKRVTGLENIGLFTVAVNNDILNFSEGIMNIEIRKLGLSFILIYQIIYDKFTIIPVKTDGNIYDRTSWIVFDKNEILPYISK